MPDVRSTDKRQVVRDFLAKEAYGLTADETERICGEVMSLIENPRFSALFGANSRAEVPIMGVVDGRIVSAQVDRLAVFDDRVLVVDFKTNRPAAEKLPRFRLFMSGSWEHIGNCWRKFIRDGKSKPGFCGPIRQD